MTTHEKTFSIQNRNVSCAWCSAYEEGPPQIAQYHAATAPLEPLRYGACADHARYLAKVVFVPAAA